VLQIFAAPIKRSESEHKVKLADFPDMDTDSDTDMDADTERDMEQTISSGTNKLCYRVS
jgi:hypothetical protein